MNRHYLLLSAVLTGSFLVADAHIFYAIIAGGVNFHHIHHGAVINSHTALTFSTRIEEAVEQESEKSKNRLFA